MFITLSEVTFIFKSIFFIDDKYIIFNIKLDICTAASTLPQSVPPPADPVHMINQMPPAPLSTQQKPPVNTQSSIYANKVKSIFTSAEFSSLSEEARREKIGEEIYNYVLQKVGEESAPKITGMIIDLPYQDFITSVQSWEGLQEKIQEGLDLLMDDE